MAAKKVLIIEDYESIKNLYASEFLRADFEVDTAESGDEGLKHTKSQEYDVIILDMLMMELSGLDFLEGFEAAEHPKTAVVVVSNLDSPDVMERAEKLGAKKYLIKSDYTPKELVEAVQAIIA